MDQPARTDPDPDAVRALARALWPAVLGSIQITESLSAPTAEHSADGRREYFASTDDQGRALTVRLDVAPLPQGQQVRVHVNTTSDNHVIQLSDQLSPAETGVALAQGASELMAVRRRADAALPPIRRDLLDAAVVGVEGDPRLALLSERDLARIGGLGWRAHQMNDLDLDQASRLAARNAFSADLDDLGLRVTTVDRDGPAFQAQDDARAFRLLAVEPLLQSATLDRIRELGLPIEELPAPDAEALLTHRATVDERDPVPAPAASATAPIGPADLYDAARHAAEARDRLSATTLESLRTDALALPPGALPKVRLMIGGGAALSSRDEQVLLVDSRGRWHVDPIKSIVQSADQVRHLYDSGLGDPHQFAGPRDRVPLTAIQLWEDTAAGRGPLIDGTARLAVDERGRAVADIQPIDGSAPIRVEVDGTPVVATGVPPEIVPGASRRIPMVPEALSTIDGYLRAIDSPAARRAQEAIAGLDDAEGRSTTVLAQLAAVPELAELRAAAASDDMQVATLADALTTLEATASWDQARHEAPGRILSGDEVADGNYDPQVGRRWMLAGIGGAAIANAEIILEANPEAEVVMVGTEAPWVLQNDVQYRALRQQHDKAFNPDATGRLHTIPNKRLGPVSTAQDPDGRTVVRMVDDRRQPLRTDSGTPLEGDVYVGCLGRVARLPKVLDALRSWAEEIRGDLMFSQDRQYLGYRLSFTNGPVRHNVEVTGAASRMLPADVFDAKAVQRVDELGLVEAPPESGNVAAGFMATALQGKRRADEQARSAPVPIVGEVPELDPDIAASLEVLASMRTDDRPPPADAHIAPSTTRPYEPSVVDRDTSTGLD